MNISTAKKITRLFKKADFHVRKFNDMSGLACTAGCGACCTKADIEATVLEFIPLGYHLWRTGGALPWLERLEQAGAEAPCVFYEPAAGDSGRGRCGVYPWRGMICRMFGFSANPDKFGRPALITCRRIKETRPEDVRRINERLATGMPVPVMRHYYMQLANISPSLARERMPINEAMRIALEIVGFSIHMKSS